MYRLQSHNEISDCIASIQFYKVDITVKVCLISNLEDGNFMELQTQNKVLYSMMCCLLVHSSIINI